MKVTQAEWIGLAATIVGVVGWLPQLFRVWCERLVAGVSMSAFSLYFLALVLWGVYGVAVDSLSLIVSSLILGSIILLIVARVWSLGGLRW